MTAPPLSIDTSVAFQHEWKAALNTWLPLPVAVRLLRAGWTADTIAEFARLVRHGVRTDGPWWTTFPVERKVHTWITERLVVCAEKLHSRGGVRPETALGWIMLLVSAPDRFTLDCIEAFVTGFTSSAPLIQEDYQNAAPGVLGPLVWAVGLSTAETRVEYRAGTLTEDGLRMLLALRGYVFPAAA